MSLIHTSRRDTMPFKKTDAIALLEKNLDRTEMLIEAMVKIKAYNRFYQMEITHDPKYYQQVKTIQDRQLTQIEQACGEHAIISMATAFETYYRELVQQLLAEHLGYFSSRRTKYSDGIEKLSRDNELAAYEQIEHELKLVNRFEYYALFKAYSLPFLTNVEKRFVEYIYLQRNIYVHNAGMADSKSRARLAKTPPPFVEQAVSTEAKRLRTRLRKILQKSYDRIEANLDQA